LSLWGWIDPNLYQTVEFHFPERGILGIDFAGLAA